MADRLVALEFHDAGLALVDAAGVRATSPSVAVAVEGGLEVGAAAAALARRDPRRMLDRFWEQLDVDPLPRPLGAARTRADVAYFHLRAFWAAESRGETEVLLAVPSSFGRAALSLLVGIARACEIPVVGVVEAGVAAAATVEDDRPRAVVDVGLHRATVTRVAVGDGFALGETSTVPAIGLARLREIWIERITARFLRETRFDPRHDSSTEQELHDRLPGWLAALGAAPAAVLELPVGERRVRIELARDALVEPARETYRALAEAALAAAPLVHVSDHLASLPGFVETLAPRAAASVLERGASGRGALAHAEEIRSDPAAPAFVTRLPGPVPGASRVPAPAAACRAARPTHVLRGERAHAIGAAPLLLAADPPRRLRAGESAHGSVIRLRGGHAVLDVPDGLSALVNGRPVAGEVPLAAGDVVRIPGAERELHLIVLEPDDGCAG